MITATHLLEVGLSDLPSPVCFVRPGSFLENCLRDLRQAASTGVCETYLMPTDRAVPMAATQDIGQEIARRLVGDWSGRQVVELGSMTCPDDLASAMTEVLGRPVQARAVPREQWADRLTEQGMPPGFIGPFVETEEGYNSGWDQLRRERQRTDPWRDHTRPNLRAGIDRANAGVITGADRQGRAHCAAPTPSRCGLAGDYSQRGDASPAAPVSFVKGTRA